MDGDNAMNCARCGEDKPTNKTMTIFEASHILIVCLKRFRDGVKDQSEVEVPFELNGRDVMMGVKEGDRDNHRANCRYGLYGVIRHSGWSLHSGHYTASCYDQTNGWVHYNDSSLHGMNKDEVMREARNGIVLMYRKKY